MYCEILLIDLSGWRGAQVRKRLIFHFWILFRDVSCCFVDRVFGREMRTIHETTRTNTKKKSRMLMATERMENGNEPFLTCEFKHARGLNMLTIGSN